MLARSGGARPFQASHWRNVDGTTSCRASGLPPEAQGYGAKSTRLALPSRRPPRAIPMLIDKGVDRLAKATLEAAKLVKDAGLEYATMAAQLTELGLNLTWAVDEAMTEPMRAEVAAMDKAAALMKQLAAVEREIEKLGSCTSTCEGRARSSGQ